MLNKLDKSVQQFFPNVSRGTTDKLEIYYQLIQKWQPKINIVSRGTIDEIVERHFIDSLQLINVIDNRQASITDLGSGAGFPGMVLAMCGYNHITLVEKNKKKVAFLRQVALETLTQVIIEDRFIEDSQLQSTQIFVSRALDSIKGLLELIKPFTNRETCCIFLKGENVDQEINDALLSWHFDYTFQTSITNVKSKIITIGNIKRR